MCGFAGIFSRDAARPTDVATLVRMRDAMTHRGPDDSGVHVDGPVGLGFRRLSVIDIPGGHQPMVDPATGVAVVFNGEIYNHRDLKRHLEARGHRFRTRSDTEVLLRSYLDGGNSQRST